MASATVETARLQVIKLNSPVFVISVPYNRVHVQP